MSTRSTNSVESNTKFTKIILLPTFAGAIATLGMFGLYLVILTVFQGFTHAIQQASQDWFWIGMVSIGFGTQIGLYAYLRLLVSATKVMNATVATATGTTTSTLGMLACCAHHLTDLAPLIALTGTSSLSSAISLLNEWKYAFIALGLVVNAIGIGITLYTIHRSRVRLQEMLAWFATSNETQVAKY